jgi:hypothetical protein
MLVCYKAKRSSKGASDAVKYAMPTGNSRIHANIEKLLLKQQELLKKQEKLLQV